MRRGQRIVVQGYTNHFKSGFADLVARNVSEQCAENEICLYCTWEDSVDDIGIKNLAAYSQIPVNAMVRGNLTEREWKKLREAAIKRAQKPLWLIGHSTSQYRRMRRPMITDVWQMLEYLVAEQQRIPKLVVIDYIQRIRPHTRDTRRVQIMDIVDSLYDLAIGFQVPVMILTQSGRDVMNRKWKMPQLYDAQETSNLEQSATAFISLYLPIKTEPLNSIIAVGNKHKQFTVTENLLFAELQKQKSGPAPKMSALHINYSDNSLSPIGDYNNDYA
jgi:replicative DNA helicase